MTTLFGTGKPGQADGTSPSFYEPGGLTVANGKLYVADTNNHAIRVIDLKTKETKTLRINGLTPPQAPEVSSNGSTPNAEELKVTAQKIRARTEGTLVINVALPAGYHLNPAAPQRYSVTVDNSKVIAVADKNAQRNDKKLTLPITIPIQPLEAGAAKVRAQATLIYCRDDNTGTCRIKSLVWNVPVEVVNDTSISTELKLSGKLDIQ